MSPKEQPAEELLRKAREIVGRWRKADGPDLLKELGRLVDEVAAKRQPEAGHTGEILNSSLPEGEQIAEEQSIRRKRKAVNELR
ncbi:MAG: hypothetical protein QM775_23900 [Pirellulales bacterium]